MNSKTTGIWFVIAAALGVFIFVFQHYFHFVAAAPSAVLPALRPAEVTSVQIFSANEPEIEADRTNGIWLLTQPLFYPAQSAAIDALVVMHRAAPPQGLPAWGKTAMMETALGTLFDWWWPAMHLAHAPPEARAEVTAALDTMLDHVEAGPRCLVHRDFFAG